MKDPWDDSRFRTPGEALNKAIKRSKGPSYGTDYICPACGLQKNGKSHPKCSRILQARYRRGETNGTD